MPRYKLTLEYHGASFCGWQRQEDGVATVQYAVEQAFKAFTAEDVTVFCSGRTDAGVHAIAQVAHVDLVTPRDPFVILRAVNAHLVPQLVAITAVEEVPDDFHARFSAKGRQYLYRIINRRARVALEDGRVWHVPQSLDADAMQEAAQVLLGTHDFTTFRDSMCQSASPIKTLDRLDVERIGNEIRIHAEARSFLHHQVRNMVGTLSLVGKGKWSMEDVKKALNACDRRAGGPTAPPDGLYFVRVAYD